MVWQNNICSATVYKCFADGQSRIKGTKSKSCKIQSTTTIKGDAPRILDEWQLVPSLWDTARYEVDQRVRWDSLF